MITKQTLHLPITGAQEEFDHLILALVKTIIDSLNEKEIVRQIENTSDLKGGISKLERWFSELNLPDYQSQIKFLRDLQELRSTGTGHRKGRSYEKIATTFTVDDGLKAEIAAFLDVPILPPAVWSLLTLPEKRRFFIDGSITINKEIFDL